MDGVESATAMDRVFFPTNREDALLLLSSLILPRVSSGSSQLALREGEGPPLIVGRYVSSILRPETAIN